MKKMRGKDTWRSCKLWNKEVGKTSKDEGRKALMLVLMTYWSKYGSD